MHMWCIHVSVPVRIMYTYIHSLCVYIYKQILICTYAPHMVLCLYAWCIRVFTHIPLTEEIKLQKIGFPDWTVFLSTLFQWRGLPFTPVKICLKFWGIPWKHASKLWGLSENLIEIWAVVIWSPISSARGIVARAAPYIYIYMHKLIYIH